MRARNFASYWQCGARAQQISQLADDAEAKYQHTGDEDAPIAILTQKPNEVS
ncbi:MAG: hypothetical protein PF501_12885 [Salinisphaera sp.]|nr:hypothetical protein [Salinisphaera sp.]